VDYAQLVKLYGESPDAEKRYSPAVCIGAHKNPIEGNPTRNTSARHSPSAKISTFGCIPAALLG